MPSACSELGYCGTLGGNMFCPGAQVTSKKEVHSKKEALVFNGRSPNGLKPFFSPKSAKWSGV
eukprot:3436335-Amphidinium_carterae.1